MGVEVDRRLVAGLKRRVLFHETAHQHTQNWQKYFTGYTESVSAVLAHAFLQQCQEVGK